MSMGCPLLDELPHRSYDVDGRHVVELDIVDSMRGPSGAVHGGLVASLADRAGAYAAVRAGQRSVVTSSVALSYLSGATAGPLRAEATVLRSGRQQGVVEVRLHDGGRHDALVATALLTVSYLPGEVPGPLPG
jgi:uncharacterized protein (TIGR00369 family)